MQSEIKPAAKSQKQSKVEKTTIPMALPNHFLVSIQTYGVGQHETQAVCMIHVLSTYLLPPRKTPGEKRHQT